MKNVEPWEVWQLAGGCLLYLHSRFGRLPDAAAAPQTPDRAATMMPFGKYRGAPLSALVDDVPYAEWLLEQGWFAEKFPQHWQYLTTLTLERGQRERKNQALEVSIVPLFDSDESSTVSERCRVSLE